MNRSIHTPLTLVLLPAALCWLFALSAIHTQNAPRRSEERMPAEVVYGIVPDAHPTTFVDERGEPSGMFVDLFSRILTEEDYRVRYVVADFPEIYAMLVRGDIDMFTSLSRSEEREDLFHFSESPSTVAWSELFISQDNQFSGIDELRNKNIALVRGVSQTDAFRRAMDDFGVQFIEIPVASFAQGADMVVNSRAYAMVAYNWFVLDDPRVKPSGFSFQPTAGYPAFSKTSRNRELARLVSQRLSDLKNDPDSYYYELYNKWILSTEETLLPWFSSVILITSFVVFLLILFVVLLRREVAKRTAQLACLNRDLEQRVEERSRQLLEMSQKARQEETMQAVSSMIAGLTHRINTPLGNAITTASIIQEHLQVSEKQQEIPTPSTKEIRLKEASSLLAGNLDSVQQLIERFKDIAVPLAGNREQEVDCGDFFLSLKEYTDTILGEGDWEQRWQAAHGKIRIHPAFTLYIFEHLFSNIRDHAYPGAGGGKIDVDVVLSSEKEDSGKSEYEISVRDYGRGIPPDAQERIYEPFFSAAESGSFNGLGLTSVYNRVIDGLGGEISCSSVPGEGTCFTIRVPSTGKQKE